jgi:hypothetical protein
MSALTDRLYLEWAAKNGEVRMLASRPPRRRGVGGSPPSKRSEADPVSSAPVPPAGVVAGVGPRAAPKPPGASCKHLPYVPKKIC